MGAAKWDARLQMQASALLGCGYRLGKHRGQALLYICLGTGRPGTWGARSIIDRIVSVRVAVKRTRVRSQTLHSKGIKPSVIKKVTKKAPSLTPHPSDGSLVIYVSDWILKDSL